MYGNFLLFLFKMCYIIKCQFTKSAVNIVVVVALFVVIFLFLMLFSSVLNLAFILGIKFLVDHFLKMLAAIST